MSRYPHRLHLALKLRNTVDIGPSFLQDLPEDLRNEYHLWADTWIIPYLDTLIPELRKLDEKKVDAP